MDFLHFTIKLFAVMVYSLVKLLINQTNIMRSNLSDIFLFDSE